jgi:acid phosphatase type 7
VSRTSLVAVRAAPVAARCARGLLIMLALTAASGVLRTAAASADPVIAAAGDIACAPDDPAYNGGEGTATRCRQRATSDLLVGAGLAAVLPLGDIQYPISSLARIKAVYDPTWGRVRSISRPVLGNHEGGWMSYFSYFNGPRASDGPAGPTGKGYYSFDVGSWHLVALNSNCSLIDCTAGSAQERWLRADLAAHPTPCTLAYWHNPRYSSGHEGSNAFVQPFWAALDDAGAEIVLSGNSHNYERFAPLDRSGAVDRGNGIRQFVVGTGGAFFTAGITTLIPGGEIAQNHTFGVLMVTLHPSSYDWQFVPIAGSSFTDSGTEQCHSPRSQRAPNAGPDHEPPVISDLRMTRRRFARRTTFRYTLSEPARVRVTIRRRLRGRYRVAGQFSQSGVAGHNGRKFRGRLANKRLGAGSFRASFVAFDAGGNRSAPASLDFQIVRRRGALEGHGRH